jgi:hypothetical protein
MNSTTTEHDLWMAKILDAVRSLRAENGQRVNQRHEQPRRPRTPVQPPNEGRG